MRTAYINAKIYQRDEEAFLIEDGEFVLFGSNEEIKKELELSDETVDLNGLYVYPGLVDSHMHLVEYGHYLNHLMLKNCKSVDQVLSEIAIEIENGSQFVIARGYDETKFTGSTYMNKEMLDRISKDIPICITRVCGHKMIVNSKVLELCGIDQESAIEGGTIDFEDGILEETAVNLVHKIWPKETVESIKEAIKKAASVCNARGITMVGSDDLLSIDNDWHMVMDAYMQLAFQQELNVRVIEQCEFESPNELAMFLDEGYTTGVSEGVFHIGPLKMVLDGSFGARTACLKEPYYDDASKKGMLVYTDEELDAYIRLANLYNMPTIAHAIGDEAMSQALRCYEEFMLQGNPLHYGVVHASLISDEDLKKIQDYNLVCYVQSLFLKDDKEMMLERLGKKRREEAYPFKTLYETNLVCDGSDAPVEDVNPFMGMYYAMDRNGLSQDQSLSLQQAFDASTKNASIANDMLNGVIKENYCADFIVLDEDLFALSKDQIKELNVRMTVMNGEIVFER